MRRSNSHASFEDKIRDERPSIGDWRIGVGDEQESSRNVTPASRRLQSSRPLSASPSSHWMDVFRDRYNLWTQNCRSSFSDVLSLSSSKESPSPSTLAAAETRRSITGGRSRSFAREYDSYSRQETVDRPIASVPRRFLNDSSKKLIYFIRHGTAFCNVCRFLHWLEDQRLTPRGWNQVAALRKHLDTVPTPEIVFTSTLSRAMETAAGVFGIPRSSSVSESQTCLLMAPQNAIDNLQSATRGLARREASPAIIALEECRERMGTSSTSDSVIVDSSKIYQPVGDGVVPNKRRLLSEAKRQFPGIDFDLVSHEQDLLYKRFDRLEGETDADVARREVRLKNILLGRPETRIAVVSHGHFLSSLLKIRNGDAEFGNAELRIYELNERGFRSTHSNLWFKPPSGGYHLYA